MGAWTAGGGDRKGGVVSGGNVDQRESLSLLYVAVAVVVVVVVVVVVEQCQRSCISYPLLTAVILLFT